ncbi:hypothetical protein NSS79_28950 [Paenibacillus sp. FSL L8-0436]|uniref:hypothetical protein n=1 Tax=Paenibacillus sp. FSL L8-0436 TaxID=2954686 RepID=UPI003159160C
MPNFSSFQSIPDNLRTLIFGRDPVSLNDLPLTTDPSGNLTTVILNGTSGSRLPEPLWFGLLQAPAAIKKQWCSVYTAQEQHCHTPAGLAEWLLYAAVASSCRLTPLLEPAAERALQQSGSRAAAVGLSYHQLLLAAAVYPQSAASGSIPWLLLVRAALREKL